VGEHGVDKVVRRHSWSFNGPNKTIHVQTTHHQGYVSVRGEMTA
jgi:hypothetical protein